MELDGRWIGRVIAREKPDAVCHLAAQISVGRSVEDPLYDAHVNVIGSIGLIEACRKQNVGRIVFASTGGAIYGDTDVIPTPESFPAMPVSPYGTAKLSVEHYLHCFHALYGLSYAALRLGNVYGPRQDPHGEAGVVAIFARALLSGVTPTINGDGTQTRDYVFVDDVVDAFVAAVGSETCGRFNVGTGVETDVNEIYRLVAEAAMSEDPGQHGQAKPGEQMRSCLDASLIREQLDWAPSFQVSDGIPRTVDYFRRTSGADSRGS
jgi:UDP-glucose 4-epimerase